MSKIIYLSKPGSVSMDNNWYELSNKNHFWIRWRFRILQKYIEPFIDTEKKILEIGCGDGVVMEQFSDELHMSIDGCDINNAAFTNFHPVPGKIFLYNIYDCHPAMVGQYDLVLLLDVIEHIDDDKDFLTQALMHLKPGGLVVIGVPAYNFLFSSYDELMGHKRRYSRKALNLLFAKVNLETIKIGYWGFSLLPVLAMRKFILKLYTGGNTTNLGYQPPNRFINWLFVQLMKIETVFFTRAIMGISLMAIARKGK